jgi:hypothetical protein
MRRLTIALLFIALLIMPFICHAAGSCTQTMKYTSNPSVRAISLVCTGDAVNGSIPDQVLPSTVLADVEGYYLYSVTAYPTAGGTAPNGGNVVILDDRGEDWLGSADGGTTPVKGLSLINTTYTNTTLPFSHFTGTWCYFAVKNKTTLTIKVTGQTTANANYTLELTFAK